MVRRHAARCPLVDTAERCVSAASRTPGHFAHGGDARRNRRPRGLHPASPPGSGAVRASGAAPGPASTSTSTSSSRTTDSRSTPRAPRQPAPPHHRRRGLPIVWASPSWTVPQTVTRLKSTSRATRVSASAGARPHKTLLHPRRLVARIACSSACATGKVISGTPVRSSSTARAPCLRIAINSVSIAAEARRSLNLPTSGINSTPSASATTGSASASSVSRWAASAAACSLSSPSLRSASVMRACSFVTSVITPHRPTIAAPSPRSGYFLVQIVRVMPLASVRRSSFSFSLPLSYTTSSRRQNSSACSGGKQSGSLRPSNSLRSRPRSLQNAELTAVQRCARSFTKMGSENASSVACKSAASGRSDGSVQSLSKSMLGSMQQSGLSKKAPTTVEVGRSVHGGRD